MWRYPDYTGLDSRLWKWAVAEDDPDSTVSNGQTKGHSGHTGSGVAFKAAKLA